MTHRAASPEIAVLGYGCRLPGASGPEAFWRLLTERRCSVGRIGPDRWSEASFLHPDRATTGATYTADAGVLDDPFGFDAAYFGVSPREAAQMDPQQRLMLHVAWEAMERAGVAPARLAGPRTGVYVGVSGLDYSNTLFGDVELAASHFMTGNTLSIVANRLAFLLDAQGPSYVIDTACSSALFAFHAACEAIRRGEIDRALVGGVNLLLSPMPFVGFSRAGMLSPTGRCHAFDAAADGYVRSEGAVCFVIGRLDEARASGDPVRGIVVGSGVNSDGRAGLLTVPNGARQADLIRTVWSASGIGPDDVAFVEAHGTGTPVGDPIEARAIGETLGRGRARPLPIGSVKSNIGHLEPASGLVGLLKAQLALEHGVYPATVGLETPNPEIAFDALNLAPAAEPVALAARTEGVWAAGVNSFGFGGANAHVAIRRPTAAEARPALAAAPRADAPLIVSAASRAALKALAARWRDRLAAAEDAEHAALTSAAAWRRPRLPHRLVVAERDPAARVAALSAFVEERETARAVAGTAPAASAPVAFVFSGNGSQWPGMGVAAYRGDAAFRESFDRTAAAIAAEGGPDLREALVADDLEARLGEAMTAQTLLLALQIALVEALAARGVRPAATMGHSVGEVAAAWAAGAIGREQAARLAVRRALAQAPLRGAGGMAAVLASAEDLEALIAEAGLEDLAVAADNSPRGATVSGGAAAIEALATAAKRRRIAVRRLKVEYPFHGPAMERIRDQLLSELADLEPRPTAVPFVSATDGARRAGETLDAGYWWRNARQPVRFRQAALALSELGCGAFLEIGPQPSLQNYLIDTLSAAGRTFAAIPSFRRQGAGAEDLAAVAARVLAEGGAVDEIAVFGPPAACAAEVPSYPWELAPHRLTPGPDALNLLRRPAPRPLLGWRATPGEGPWRTTLDPLAQPWLADHVVDGAPALPAAAFLEMAAAAGLETFGEIDLEILDFEVARPAVFESGARLDLRVSLDPESGATRIESRVHGGEGGWILNASGVVRALEGGAERPAEVEVEVGGEALDAETVYKALAGSGLSYGPAFARLREPRVAGRAAAAALAPGRVGGRWAADPTAIDAAFHLLAPLAAAEAATPPGVAFVPVRIGRLRLRQAGEPARVVARLSRRGARTLLADFALIDAAGDAAASLEGVRFQAIRLRRGDRAVAPFWRETIRPVRPAGDAPAATPEVWRSPAKRLRTLGLTRDEPPEATAGELILDAACRRVVWEAARALAPEGGVRFRARKLLATPLRRALEAGLHALTEDAAYDPEADRALEAAPAPALDELARALVLEAPRSAEAFTALLRLREALSGGRRGAAERVAGARETAEVWGLLERAAADLLSLWPKETACVIALVGAAPEALAATLEEAGASRVVAAATPAALEGGPFDAVLVEELGGVDPGALRALAAEIAPGGTLLAGERRNDLLFEMLRATEGEAAAAEIAPLAERLAAAGFRDAAAGEAAHGLSLAAARRETPPAARSAPQPDRVVAIAPAAGPEDAAVADRLRDALREAGLETETAGDGRGRAELALLGPAGAGAEGVADAIDALRRALSEIRPSRVWAIARGAHPAAEGPHDPAEAAFARALRSVANERPDLDLRLIDLGPAPGARELLAAAAEIAAPSAEPALLLGGGRRRAPRIEPAGDVAESARAEAAGEAAALRLEADPLGGLETLRWRSVARRAPGPGEVEIEVRAVGLNFRDVMWAMGALPEEAIEDGFAGTGLGMECAGVVVRAGEGTRFRVGDRVIAFARHAFASHVTASAAAVGALPEEVDFAAAATLPVAFATAWRGLIDLGALSAGESVLIHGGAGGVGLAALQIARARGARAFATAGTPEKRALLEMLGAEAVFDSRGLDFADAVMAATAGRGVDVALNSLSGAAMERTLDCVAPFGRFVELGKRDFYGGGRLAMRPLRRNVAYFGVDLDAMLAARPDSARPLLEALGRGLAAGEIAPLPHRVEAGGNALDAFRLMQRSGHIGKIVLTPPPLPTERAAVAPAEAAPLARADAAYLVVGGTRGFGLRLAERLVERGARRLWLTGRSGALSDTAAAEVARLRARGAQVEIVACDAADAVATRALLARIEAAGAPLRGVAHAAMHLDDALLQNLDRARLEAVLRPKLDGARTLDALTRGLTRNGPLDWFVLFSSVSAVFGNPGQTAYVAANAALESVAAARREAGLPALAAQFGPIADAGVLASDAKARARLERKGAGTLTSAAALDALETALEATGRGVRESTLVIAPMRWELLKGDLRTLSTPLFERLDLETGAAAASAAEDLLTRIGQLGEGEAVKAAAELLRAEAAAILRLPPEEVDLSRPLSEIGFDSLMGVELKLSAEEKFGLSLPALALSEGATLSGLAARVARDLRGGAAQAEAAEDAPAVMLTRHAGAELGRAIEARFGAEEAGR